MKFPENAKQGHARKMYIHQHNSLAATVALASANMERIISGVSTTKASKELARWLLGQLGELEELMKTRVDHKGVE